MARRVPFTLATRSVPRIAIRPENTALLVQDVQKYFADPEGGYNGVARARGVEREFTGYYEQVGNALQNISRMIQMARERGMPIFYTRFAYEEARCVSLLQRSLGIEIHASSDEAQILPQVAPAPADVVLVKTGFSAFSNPLLADELRARLIENIFVTGVMTEFGIRATAYSALDAGFRPIIISDGCAGVTRETHSLATSEMTFGMMKVRTAGEIIRYLSGLDFDDIVLV